MDDRSDHNHNDRSGPKVITTESQLLKTIHSEYLIVLFAQIIGHLHRIPTMFSLLVTKSGQFICRELIIIIIDTYSSFMFELLCKNLGDKICRRREFSTDLLSTCKQDLTLTAFAIRLGAILTPFAMFHTEI